MHKNNKSMVAARRAWNLLRLALLWARRGGVLKKRLMMMLNPKYFTKTIRNYTIHHHRKGGILGYGERELSFDDTPVMHVKMHRPSSLRFKMPSIPCINPQAVDFDYDFGHERQHDDDDDVYYYPDEDEDVVSRKSFLKGGADNDNDDDDDDDQEEEEDDDDDQQCQDLCQEINGLPFDDGIDLKAEQFIAKFYQQIKLQRQISCLQYAEMISRGAS